MKILRNLTLLTLLIAVFTLTTACGSSSDDTTDPVSPGTQTQSAETLKTAVTALADSIGSASASISAAYKATVAYETVTLACTSGTSSIRVGTDEDDPTYQSYLITQDNCVAATGITTDGSIEIIQSGETLTLTVTDYTFEEANGDGYSTNGSATATFVDPTATITLDDYTSTITASGETTTLTMDGELTLTYDSATETSTVDGSVTMTFVEGSVTTATVTCTYSNFNVDTSTTAQWAASCAF